MGRIEEGGRPTIEWSYRDGSKTLVGGTCVGCIDNVSHSEWGKRWTLPGCNEVHDRRTVSLEIFCLFMTVGDGDTDLPSKQQFLQTRSSSEWFLVSIILTIKNN